MNSITRQTTKSFSCRFGLHEMVHMTGKIDNCLNALNQRLRDHLTSIRVKFWRIKMAMAVDPHCSYAVRFAANARFTRESGARPSACEMNCPASHTLSRSMPVSMPMPWSM